MTVIIRDVKAVKNSVFIKESNGDYVCIHYDTEIFRASKDEKGDPKLKNLNVPSVTSSKMARRCFEHVFGYLPPSDEWKGFKEMFGQ